MTKMLVVVVDDDAEVRGSIESLVRSAGFAVRGFSRAETFLASTVLTTTRCLITDLHLPAMDGVALLRQLRRSGHLIPTVVITGFPSPTDRTEAAEVGAAAFLEKPLDPEVLVRAVTAACAS